MLVFDQVQNDQERSEYLAKMKDKRLAYRAAKARQRRTRQAFQNDPEGFKRKLNERYPWANIEDVHVEESQVVFRLVSKKPLSRGGRQRWHSPLF
jgi:hypothetical protein